MRHNILITGGNGKTGKRISRLLKEKEQVIKIGSRKGSPAFDWDNPDTFSAVLKGIDRAYLAYSPDLAVPGAKKAIQNFTGAALQAGVEKVVLLSGKGEKEAEACEEIVANSGLNYTLVRASWFNQNFSEESFMLEPVLAGHVALPMPEAAIPFVDADDIAAVACEALLNDKLNGQTLTVTGPRKISFREVVDTIAAATKRPIQYHPVSLQEYTQMMQSAGLPPDYIWLFEYLFREVLGKPEYQEVTQDVAKVLGRKPIDFKEYVTKTAATGVWNPEATEVSD